MASFVAAPAGWPLLGSREEHDFGDTFLVHRVWGKELLRRWWWGGEITNSSHWAVSVGLCTKTEKDSGTCPTSLGMVMVESPPQLSNLLKSSTLL